MTMLQDLRKQLTELFEMVEWGGERYGQECCPTCLGFKNPPLGDLSGYGMGQGHYEDCRLMKKYQAMLALIGQLATKDNPTT